MRSKKPAICVVGNLLGHNLGYGTTQGQILAYHLRAGGNNVVSCSSVRSRVFRLADIIVTILRNKSSLDLMIVEVYSGLSFVIADVASVLGKWLKIPLIAVLHGGNLPQFSNRYPRWTSRVLRRFDRRVAPSAFLARELRRLGLQLGVIPNVIDLTAYPHRLRRRLRPALLWMRAFHSIYNPEMALQVLAEVRCKHPDATLVMAGVDKGLENDIKGQAREMGMGDKVMFPGFLDSNAKISEFANADIFLNTNIIDNMPVAVLEACAMGLCVVATDVGGLRDLIINRENGLLVQDRNVREMADAVNELLVDSDLSENISRNGRLLAELSAWTNVQPMWEALFAEVLDQRQKENIDAKLLETSSS